MCQLREAHTQCAKDQRRITELEEKLEILQEQAKILERQLSQYHMKEEEMKSVQDEISSLEEVRYVITSGKELIAPVETDAKYRDFKASLRLIVCN